VLLNPRTLRFAKFLAVGGFLFLFGYAQIVLYNERWGLPLIPSQIVSGLACMHMSFFISELGIWNAQRQDNPSIRNRYTKFVSAKIIGVGLNSIIFAFISTHFSTFVSVSIATALILFYNFYVAEKYVYAKTN